MARDVDLGWPTVGVSHITDAKTDYTSGDLDSEAEIITAINAANVTLNAALVALETAGEVSAS